MPQWAGSCWYYLRFCDPKNDAKPWSAEAEKYWMSGGGVDLYVGGAEHADRDLRVEENLQDRVQRFHANLVSTQRPSQTSGTNRIR